MTTSAVIPIWKGEELLRKSFPAIARCNFDEIIIVDDASPDDSAKFIKSKYPQVVIVKHDTNKGFVESVNDGVRVAKGEVVFLFNQDVTPVVNVKQVVTEHFSNPSVFGVSFHEKGFGWARPKIDNGYIVHVPGAELNKPHATFWISGGSSAFRKSVWNKLGGFDTMFSPFYWEDLEISYRALRRGYKLIWEPKALVLHKHESTINPKNFYSRRLNWVKDRNQLLLVWKHWEWRNLLFNHLPGLLRRLSKPGYWIVLLMAVIRLPQVLKGRIIEKKEAKLSNEEVIQLFK